MDLFEVIFILLFILLPLLEGLRKNRGKAQRPGEPGRPGSTASTSDRPAGPREEPTATAADMVPPDLWEVLTGERRPGGAAAPGREPTPPMWEADPYPVEGAGAEEPAWSTDVVVTEAPGGLAESWMQEREEEAAGFGPVSLEYEGPEAYSLEAPPPPPETRHRQFHARLDAARLEVSDARARRRPPPDRLSAMLRPSGLRDAMVLKEILGPPKGLD